MLNYCVRVPSVQYIGLVLVWLSKGLEGGADTCHIVHTGGRCSGNDLRPHFGKSRARISPRTQATLLEVSLVCGFCRVFKMYTAVKCVPARAMDLHRMGRGVPPLGFTYPGAIFD